MMADGARRPHWQKLLSGLDGLGPAEIRNRWEQALRLIHDNGITYNVYSESQDNLERPWPLDMMPQIMAGDEWARLEAAIQQRARLFNLILKDLYGPRRLLAENRLPPDLIFSHPGYLRPCHGIEPNNGSFLTIYAADLVRAPDGQWWVVADRTQAPSGSGYALENRIVMRRSFPDLFEKANVRRLAHYFQKLRDALIAQAHSVQENPRIAVLTPGPYNETYFEHAYLARYLGYTLVEGGDLTCRDNRVYLKTLGGLLPIDLVLRRQDDSFCDPLELRGDSMLGVPGLVQAVRAGGVTVANSLGSGLVEAPAMAAFLPALCRTLLGEELRVPSVATWWCGQDKPRSYVIDHLDELVVKGATVRRRREPIFASKLSANERESLLAKMRASPHRYIAQERVSLSTTPTWVDGKMQPRYLVVRVYAVSDGDNYAVMPGGLSRFTPSIDTLDVSMQEGGGSKDTWVLGDTESPDLTLLRPRAQPIDVSRATFDLPSRVAENLFWLGRYAERVDASVRIVRSVLPLLAEESVRGAASALHAAVSLLRDMGYLTIAEGVDARRNPARLLERELTAMIYDAKRRGGFGWGVQNLRRLAWLLRDRISADAWRILNRLHQDFTESHPVEPTRVSSALDLLDRAIISLSAFSGLVMESMTRGHGWRLLEVGRRLERAIQLVQLLRRGLATPAENSRARLEMLLEIADSSITYRSRYLTSLQDDLTIDLLLIDEANPRSVAFQLARMSEHIDELPQGPPTVRRSPAARIVLGALTAVRLADLERLASLGPDGSRVHLEELLAKLAEELPAVSEALTRRYLIHAVASRQLSRN